jgi:hypothetical protein
MTTAGTFRACSTFIAADLVFFGLKQGLISINSVNFPLVVLLTVVLQLSNADKFVAERLSCVPTLPNRKACR